MLMNMHSVSARTYPLSLATEGEWVRVVTVSGGKNMLKRLFAMGITDGSELEIMSRRINNSIVMRYQENHWAIGHSIAHKILVTNIDPPC